MNMWKWPNVHEIDPSPEPLPDAEPLPTGRAKVQRPALVRGWQIIPAADVKPSDVVLARYPD